MQICCGDAEIAMATHISDSPECSGKTQQTQQVAVRRINNMLYMHSMII